MWTGKGVKGTVQRGEGREVWGGGGGVTGGRIDRSICYDR